MNDDDDDERISENRCTIRRYGESRSPKNWTDLLTFCVAFSLDLGDYLGRGISWCTVSEQINNN